VQVGEILNGEAGASNMLFHRHGDEFAVLLRDLTADEALARAERLRMAIEGAAFEIGGERLPSLTISVGVATHRADETHRELMNRADNNNQKAKSAGRNRTHHE
jgi:diguanylate cyclase